MRFIVILLAILPLAGSCLHVSKGLNHDAEDRVVETAESFFVDLKERSFDSVWESLSSRSRERIVDDVFRSAKRGSRTLAKSDVEDDFASGGLLFMSYWNSFRAGIDVDSVLDHDIWKVESIDNKEAVVNIIHPESKGLTRFKLFREQGRWKVGLVETFWPNRARKVLEIMLK